MIGNRTVFVIGAGASVPYMFPSGLGLLNEYRKHDSNLITRVTHGTVSDREAKNLHTALCESSSGSIDAILENRPDLEASGKSLIAAHLLSGENHYRSKSVWEFDWIQYLIGLMSEDVHDPDEFSSKNNVSFITYNYDRLLEYRLARHLRANWPSKTDAIDTALSRIPVIHLHGSLGSLSDGNDWVPFGGHEELLEDDLPTERSNWIRNATRHIKIVHQVDGDNPEFYKARNILRAAELVVFLGFGFGKANVERLGFDNVLTTAVVASHFGLTESEYEKNFVRRINATRPRHYDFPYRPEWDCLRTLREHAARIV